MTGVITLVGTLAVVQSGWYYPPFFFFFWLIPLTFFLLAWIFFWRFRWRRGFGWYGCGQYVNPASDPAAEILRVRLARGKISQEEYENLREKLKRPPVENMK